MITKRIPAGRPPIEKGRHAMDNFANSIKTMKPEDLLIEFCKFINEREEIRKKKEAGLPQPWTSDEILAKSKFSNIYRQHDKVSSLIYTKLKNLKGDLLVYNLLLARLINRCDILNEILPANPNNPPTQLLKGNAVIMNPGAYQVSPGMAKLDVYDTNRETIIFYLPKIYKEVYKALISSKDIETVVELGNKAFGGHIKFVMLQIVLDIQHMKNCYNVNSSIPVGQGAKALCEKLGGLDTLSVKLGMKKYDIEHALCEFRKYLSRKDKIPNNAKYRPNHLGTPI